MVGIANGKLPMDTPKLLDCCKATAYNEINSDGTQPHPFSALQGDPSIATGSAALSLAGITPLAAAQTRAAASEAGQKDPRLLRCWACGGLAGPPCIMRTPSHPDPTPSPTARGIVVRQE